MLLACKVAVRVTERTRTAYLSMLVMCLCIRLCIRLMFVKINSYICVNKKEKHIASPYVYVNLMLQGCQIRKETVTSLPEYLPVLIISSRTLSYSNKQWLKQPSFFNVK